jgi:hypothetical protein
VIIKGAQHIRIHNERDALLKFQGRAPLRRLVDEVEESTQPPGIVLEHMDDDLLAAGKKKTLNRTEIKHVAKIVLQALDVLHNDGYVHTGMFDVSLAPNLLVKSSYKVYYYRCKTEQHTLQLQKR